MRPETPGPKMAEIRPMTGVQPEAIDKADDKGILIIATTIPAAQFSWTSWPNGLEFSR